jgi:hypothetical protein
MWGGQGWSAESIEETDWRGRGPVAAWDDLASDADGGTVRLGQDYRS